MTEYKVDILAFAAHPDDVELSCSGTLIKHIQMGKKVALVDLTLGELGSNGTVETRKIEAEISSKIMGISYRENLGLRDGFFEIDEQSLLTIIQSIRKYQPEIILANAPSDRHPDHGRAAALIERAFFLAGLTKITTRYGNKNQLAYRPKALYHYIQDNYLEPDFVVDITPYFNQKKACIDAFSSQFFTKNQTETQKNTPISSEDFYHFIEARSRNFGRIIQCTYAEGFKVNRTPGVNLLTDLI